MKDVALIVCGTAMMMYYIYLNYKNNDDKDAMLMAIVGFGMVIAGGVE